MEVAVVTDTTTYLPRATLARAGVHEVSLYISWRADALPEARVNGELGAFYERLRTDAEIPTTSQPSTGDFLNVYRPLLAAGRDVVSIHLSGAISGTTDGARRAAEEAVSEHPGRRIEVVDSQSACGGLGLIVLAAAAAARDGLDVDGVARRALDARASHDIWFAVDTLEFLRRGGRIGRVQAWLGGALSIKPILGVDAEGIRPVERARTERRAFERMADFAQRLCDEGRTAYCVQHIQAPEAAARLAARATDIVGREPLFVSEIGPVIGAHTGPGLLGIGGTTPEALR